MPVPFLLTAGKVALGFIRSPKVLAGIALVAAGGAAVGYMSHRLNAAYERGVVDGKTAQLLIQYEEVEKARLAAKLDRQTTERAIADAISRITLTQQTIQRATETKIIERPVYRDCRADDDVMRLFNAAMSGSGSSGVPTNTERIGSGELSF